MTVNVNLNIYKSGGRPHTVRVFSLKEGEPCNLPDGAVVIYAHYWEQDDVVEVWAAVPDTSVIASKTTSFLDRDAQIEQLEEPQLVDTGAGVMFMEDELEFEEVDSPDLLTDDE